MFLSLMKSFNASRVEDCPGVWMLDYGCSLLFPSVSYRPMSIHVERLDWQDDAISMTCSIERLSREQRKISGGSGQSFFHWHEKRVRRQ